MSLLIANDPFVAAAAQYTSTSPPYHHPDELPSAVDQCPPLSSTVPAAANATALSSSRQLVTTLTTMRYESLDTIEKRAKLSSADPARLSSAEMIQRAALRERFMNDVEGRIRDAAKTIDNAVAKTQQQYLIASNAATQTV